MKKFSFFLMSCFLATSMFFVVGCEDKDDPDNPNNSVPDPEGTITIKVFNEAYGRLYTGVYPDGCEGYFFISPSNNFYGRNGQWSFASVGKVSGLNNVTKIPSSGYAREIAVEPGYGYVAKNEISDYYGSYGNVTYVRVYVMDWLIDTSGGIMGAEIKYQSPFVP